MEKVKVSFENILASLLVRFGKANVTDIKVIQDDLFNKYGILMSPFALDYRGISNHIMKVGDNYYPLDGSKTVLEEKQGTVMSDYLSNINIEDLVLLKINELGSVSEYQIGTVFCDEQEKVISKLVDDLKIVYVWNSDVPYDDYQELQLTFLGNSRVFELQNSSEIEEFRQLLITEGYDASLIPEFLRRQDFSKGVYEILNIDNFLLYCCTYDRAARVDEGTVVRTVKKN
jgi:hypothetical protein